MVLQARHPSGAVGALRPAQRHREGAPSGPVQRGLGEHCRRLPNPNLEGMLGCAIVLMGWSWGFWLAEAALEALVHLALRPERQLVHGAPLPRFTMKEMEAYWFYIDDFGVLGFAQRVHQ